MRGPLVSVLERLEVAEGVSIDEVVAHLEARGFRWGSSDGN